jgi:hypothetical protein
MHCTEQKEMGAGIRLFVTVAGPMLETAIASTKLAAANAKKAS